MRRANLVALLCLGLLSALALAGCSLFPGSWELYGTWTNPDYNGMLGGPPAKIVINENGTEQYYNNVSDTIPLATVDYAILDDWTDSGIHWYKSLSDSGGTPMYTLIKLYDSGNTMESNSDLSTYPTTIDPSGSYYGIFYRQ